MEKIGLPNAVKRSRGSDRVVGHLPAGPTMISVGASNGLKQKGSNSRGRAHGEFKIPSDLLVEIHSAESFD